jgi:hypothetical protein
VTIDDWRANVNFDHNNAKFSKLLKFIKQKGISHSKMVGILGFEGVRRVGVFTLKEGLARLWPGVS